MINSLEQIFKRLSMSGKNNRNTEKSSSEQKKINKKKIKPQQNPQQMNKENKTTSNPRSPSNQQKDNQKSKNKKKENKEKSESDSKKQNNKIDDKSKPKSKKSNKQSKEGAVKSDPKKSPKSKVIKQNLKKTDKKTLSQTTEFELSVEKIKKIENSGYKKLKLLGEGSYGKVFKAKSVKHRKQVAIKCVDLKRLSEHFQEKYLIVEIELMKKMTEHKNVIKFYEVIEAMNDHLLYISMEFCPNGDLFDYILRRHFIPEREACLWFKQLLSGVEHVHKNGYAHRDIKCENLLLDGKYNIKIVDFGFCCKIRYQKNFTIKEDKIVNTSDEELPSQTYCGSIVYSAPEVLRGQPYLPTMADIWSSGVVLYVMLFGSYPNDGKEMDRFIEMDEHCIEAPESPQVSVECKELVKEILVDENNRNTIKDIKDSKWFKKKWKSIDTNITTEEEYFKNLNIQRVETLEFEYSPTLHEKLDESVKSDDNSELKDI